MRFEDDIGSTLGSYRLEAVIGRGGMSVVYLAEHIHLGKKVALKVLSPALAQDQSFRERFLRESRVAASIDHANIIPIFDAGETDGRLYIAMRYGSRSGTAPSPTSSAALRCTASAVRRGWGKIRCDA